MKIAPENYKNHLRKRSGFGVDALTKLLATLPMR